MSDTSNDSSNENIDDTIEQNQPKVFYSVETQCNIASDKQSKHTQTENNNNQVNKKHNCCIEKNLKRILDLDICPALNAIINGLLLDSCHEDKTEENVKQISESIFVYHNDSGIENISNANDISKENIQNISENVQNVSNITNINTSKRDNEFKDSQNDCQFQNDQKENDKSKTNLNDDYQFQEIQDDEYTSDKKDQLQNIQDDKTTANIEDNNQFITKTNISPKLTTTIELVIDDSSSVKIQNQIDLENYVSDSSDLKLLEKSKTKRKRFTLLDSSSSVESVRNATSNDKMDDVILLESDNMKIQKRQKVNNNLEKNTRNVDENRKNKDNEKQASKISKTIKTEPQTNEIVIITFNIFIYLKFFF